MANYDIPQYPTKRLRYFNNQFLNDQDFIDDSASQIGHERAVLRSLCVAGVCEGLVVSYPAANQPPSVSAGVAIDKNGCMIVIGQPTAGRANPAGLADGDYFVYISFLEAEDARATSQGASDYTRWTQTPVINATAKTAALPDGVVVLGSCTVKTGQFVGSGTTIGRQYSGLRLPGPNQSAAATLHNTGAADDLAVLGGSLTARRDASGQIGPTLTLLNNGNAAGSGTAIDFNGYDPGSNDPTLRIRSLDDGNWSSHVTFSTKQSGASTNKLVERMRLTSGGNLGIGTQAPDDILHVLHADTVGTFESSTTGAAIRVVTSEGMNNQVQFANRSGGNAAIWVGTGGDALIVKKDGGVAVSKASGGTGILTVENCLKFPNEYVDKIVIWDGGTTDRYGIGLSSYNINLFYPSAGHFSLRQNSSSGSEVFSVSGTGAVTLSGPIQNSLTVRRDVAGQLGPTLTLLNGGSSANAGGSIDFNGYDPGTNAPSLRIQSLDDGNCSSHLTFSTKASGAQTNALVERLRLTSDGVLKFPNEAPKDKIVLWDNGTNRFGVGINSGNLNLFYPPSNYFSLRQNGSSGTEVFRVDGSGNATFSGRITPKVGNDGNSGIYFPTNPGGGGGDEAFLRYYVQSGETCKLMLGINNDGDDTLGLYQAGGERITLGWGNIYMNAMTLFSGYYGPNSDLTLKHDVRDLESILAGVMQLRPVRFAWNADNRQDLGFIAQDVAALFPELVFDAPAADTPAPQVNTSVPQTAMPPNPLKGLSSHHLAVIAVAAVRELKQELDTRVGALEQKLAAPGATP